MHTRLTVAFRQNQISLTYPISSNWTTLSHVVAILFRGTYLSSQDIFYKPDYCQIRQGYIHCELWRRIAWHRNSMLTRSALSLKRLWKFMSTVPSMILLSQMLIYPSETVFVTTEHQISKRVLSASLIPQNFNLKGLNDSKTSQKPVNNREMAYS